MKKYKRTYLKYKYILLAVTVSVGAISFSYTKHVQADAGSTIQGEHGISPLPERPGPRIRTTGAVPHMQVGVTVSSGINKKVFQRAFSLPGVENQSTIVSLPGARGLWLNKNITLAHPKAIVSGREFAHIHRDGSLHAPLPYKRALEVDKKGWGERHPWADDRDGWDGFVMIFTPQSEVEADIVFQLIVESYNYVTGKKIKASDF